MKVKEVFEKSLQFLKDRHIETPRLETELLIASVMQTDRVGIYLKFDAPLSKPEIDQLRDLILRKSKGEPTAYLVGEKYFFNRPFFVGPGVLIPRPETEEIVEHALESILNNRLLPEQGSLAVADLGCGSGCIGLSLGLELLKSRPSLSLTVEMIEKSSEALVYAEKNCQRLVPEEDREKFRVLHSSVENWNPQKKFDFILANPPYIDPKDLDVSETVKRFEPAAALFAEGQGLQSIESWLYKALLVLAPQGEIYFEIGHRQGEQVKNLFEATKAFDSVQVLKDFNKKDRFIKAVKNG